MCIGAMNLVQRATQNVQFVGPQLCSLVGASQSLSKGLVHHRAAMFFLSLQDELHAGPSSGSMLHKDHNMDPSFDLMYVFSVILMSFCTC